MFCRAHRSSTEFHIGDQFRISIMVPQGREQDPGGNDDPEQNVKHRPQQQQNTPSCDERSNHAFKTRQQTIGWDFPIRDHRPTHPIGLVKLRWHVHVLSQIQRPGAKFMPIVSQFLRQALLHLGLGRRASAGTGLATGWTGCLTFLRGILGPLSSRTNLSVGRPSFVPSTSGNTT